MMSGKRKTRAIAEFGDYQTPPVLAFAATRLLLRIGIRPRSILEPSCGRGAFITAAALSFPEAETIIGIDINHDHLHAAQAAMRQQSRRVELRQGDFFKLEWEGIVTKSAGPWLILGNPPWVTSADLGAIGSVNVPRKSNVHRQAGIEAITGKSNFDISEWMLLRALGWLDGSAGTIAVLCKTAVARKILLHVWRKKLSLRAARMYKIDARKHFGAAVDACFFILDIQPDTRMPSCDIFDSLEADKPSRTLGLIDGHVVSDIETFNRYRNLIGPDEHYVWRSGIKHDCSKVMELTPTPTGYQNGLRETVALEDTALFPMLKSSDIGNGRLHCRGVLIVTQRFVGEDTLHLRTKAPKTYEYLHRHAALLERRGSAIYRNQPAFAIFGVGRYSFAPWKVAISGFYKKLRFVTIGPVNGRPVVFDDTIYFLPCWSEEEASFLEALLRSEAARSFLQSMIHWEDKRPITAEILKRLSIGALAKLLGREQEYRDFAQSREKALFQAARTLKSRPTPVLDVGEQLRLF